MYNQILNCDNTVFKLNKISPKFLKLPKILFQLISILKTGLKQDKNSFL